MPYLPELVIICLIGPLFGDLSMCPSSVSRRTRSPAANLMIASPTASASANEDAGYGLAVRVRDSSSPDDLLGRFVRFFLALPPLAFLPPLDDLPVPKGGSGAADSELSFASGFSVTSDFP